jgi:hypothetical protein
MSAECNKLGTPTNEKLFSVFKEFRPGLYGKKSIFLLLSAMDSATKRTSLEGVRGWKNGIHKGKCKKLLNDLGFYYTRGIK